MIRVDAPARVVFPFRNNFGLVLVVVHHSEHLFMSKREPGGVNVNEQARMTLWIANNYKLNSTQQLNSTQAKRWAGLCRVFGVNPSISTNRRNRLQHEGVRAGVVRVVGVCVFF